MLLWPATTQKNLITLLTFLWWFLTWIISFTAAISSIHSFSTLSPTCHSFSALSTTFHSIYTLMATVNCTWSFSSLDPNSIINLNAAKQDSLLPIPCIASTNCCSSPFTEFFFFLLFFFYYFVDDHCCSNAFITVPSDICRPIPLKSTRSRNQIEYTIALGNLMKEFWAGALNWVALTHLSNSLGEHHSSILASCWPEQLYCRKIWCKYLWQSFHISFTHSSPWIMLLCNMFVGSMSRQWLASVENSGVLAWWLPFHRHHIWPGTDIMYH